MTFDINDLTDRFSTIKLKNNNLDNCMATTIQKHYRGFSSRKSMMPLVMYKIQTYLKTQVFDFSSSTDDGRINSCIDEDKLITILTNKFGDTIKKPGIRMWYDILAYDNSYGWIPINIKSTTTFTSDNTGNLAMCVHAYTNVSLNVHQGKSYDNGKMSQVLMNALKNKQFNTNDKKDYYFLVLNKNNPNDIIINSVKGLTTLTPNSNNLPFQVCWNKNRTFNYKPIQDNIDIFIKCLQRPKPSWKESFMSDIRTL